MDSAHEGYILVGLRRFGSNFNLRMISVTWLWLVMIDALGRIGLLFAQCGWIKKGFASIWSSFLWTHVPQLAALALHSSPKVCLDSNKLLVKNCIQGGGGMGN